MGRLPTHLAETAARVDWTPERTRRLAELMPKVETHLHLDGSLSPETVARLAAEQGYAPLQGLTPAEIRGRIVVDSPRSSLVEVLAAFDAYYPLLKTPAAVETSAYELIREAARQNVLYCEVRFAPALQATPGFPAQAVLEAALKGLERGRRDFGTDSGVIICLLRPFAFVDRDANEAMTKLAVAFAGRGVVGLDVAGDEAAEPLTSYEGWLRRGRAAGLGLTVHAGETPGGRTLETALELGVERLGHATHLAEYPSLTDEVRRRGVVIEANPTSNLRTRSVASYAAHPIGGWRRDGLRTTVSTDDPGLFAIDLAHEYLVLNEHLGFSPAELLALSYEGISALFLPEAKKKILTARFEKEAALLFKEVRA